jgi:hypothetical protein
MRAGTTGTAKRPGTVHYRRGSNVGSPLPSIPVRLVAGKVHVAMMEKRFRLRPAEVHDARSFARSRLSDLGIDPDHVDAVDTVAGEFMALAGELGARDTVRLTIEPFHLLTSIRLRCSRHLSVRDKPFGPRERILEKLTLAHGTRRNADGTEDMWAEVPRSSV